MAGALEWAVSAQLKPETVFPLSVVEAGKFETDSRFCYRNQGIGYRAVLWYVLDGYGEVSCQEQCWPMKQGQALLLEGGHPFCCQAEHPWKVLWTVINSELSGYQMLCQEGFFYGTPPEPLRFQTEFEQICQLAGQDSVQAQAGINSCLSGLLTQLLNAQFSERMISSDTSEKIR